ncbi:hypothetical protein ElyMa_001662800 [Elysia marginata]|uniref:Uncharacterized protein n=1 Tax=Elysia marginata TaxID=1093978 RepID=A0AAV4JRR4_9GAST|nr:hypothetical protein ElyMa_001662800 [Elysia marginata]
MSKRSLVSPAEVDGHQRVKSKSRTRLKRLEMKEKHGMSSGSDAVKAIRGSNNEAGQGWISPLSNPETVTARHVDSLNESPLNASHDHDDDPENDEFAGLRFCSQDDGLNQSVDGDSQCEVRWDCYSPQTVKELKKLRGQYNAEGVKQIVANFNDAHVKPQESSVLKLLPFPGPGPSAPFKEFKPSHRLTRASTKKPRRVTTKKAVQEMILLLQNKISNKEKETQLPKVLGGHSGGKQTLPRLGVELRTCHIVVNCHAD